ncbi:MAG: CdaR family protein [Candidatus Dormibacterales bacterium]
MGWVTNNWRLKVASLVLCLALLGAVAFSQNPITFRTLQASVDPTPLPAGISILNWSPTVPVPVSGLRADVADANGNNVVARMDLSKLHHTPGTPPATETVTVVPQVLASGVTARVSQFQVPLLVDSTDTNVPLSVSVRLPHLATGWIIQSKSAQCGNSQNSCTVKVSGPESMVSGLSAYVELPETISGEGAGRTADILFEQGGRQVKLVGQPTLPRATVSPTTAQVSWRTTQPVEYAQAVLVDSQPSGGPAPGYRVWNVTLDPLTITVSGPPSAIQQVSTILLPAVDLSGVTSNVSQIVAIPVPKGLTASVKFVRVTYLIKPNPNIKPSPPPSPTPSPSSSP